MKSVSLINPSGREVRVPDNRVPRLLGQGFSLAPVPEPKAPVVMVSRSAPAPAAPEAPEAPEAPDLDSMDREALAAIAEARGLEFDGRFGAKRLRELLSE